MPLLGCRPESVSLVFGRAINRNQGLRLSPQKNLSTPLRARFILSPVSPSGTPVMTVIAWGGTGASDRSLAWRSVRGVRPKCEAPGGTRAPARHYPRGDGLGDANRKAENAGRWQPSRANGADRTKNRRRGARFAPPLPYSAGTALAPRFPNFFAQQWPGGKKMPSVATRKRALVPPPCFLHGGGGPPKAVEGAEAARDR